MHPKSTLREALEPTWTALGRPGAKTLKKGPRYNFWRVTFGPPWVKTSKTCQKYKNPRVTFGVHFEAFLSPGVHQGSPDLKKDDFLGDSFLDHFFASTRAPQNVLGSVLATVSARFSQVQ